MCESRTTSHSQSDRFASIILVDTRLQSFTVNGMFNHWISFKSLPSAFTYIYPIVFQFIKSTYLLCFWNSCFTIQHVHRPTKNRFSLWKLEALALDFHPNQLCGDLQHHSTNDRPIQAHWFGWFLLVCTGKRIEWPFTQAIFRKNVHVLSTSHVMRHVFDLKLDGIKVEGNNSYPKRALLWISPAGVTFTQEDCEYLMGEYFALCKEAGTILADIVPSFDSTTGYHEADHWQKYLDLDDLNQVFNLSYLKPSFGDQATFFKS